MSNINVGIGYLMCHTNIRFTLGGATVAYSCNCASSRARHKDEI
jgi:hypothetical protein